MCTPHQRKVELEFMNIKVPQMILINFDVMLHRNAINIGESCEHCFYFWRQKAYKPLIDNLKFWYDSYHYFAKDFSAVIHKLVKDLLQVLSSIENITCSALTEIEKAIKIAQIQKRSNNISTNKFATKQRKWPIKLWKICK